MRNLCAAFALLLSIAVPAIAFAHGDMLSYEIEVAGYFIDIGYDEAIAGMPMTFDLGLFKRGGEGRAVFDFAWVRLNKSGHTVFAGPVSSMNFGKPGFTIALSEPGEYAAHVTYMAKDKTLAEASFPFEVGVSEVGKGAKMASALAVVLAVASSFALGRLLKRHA